MKWKEHYPATYNAFFIYELKKPYSPFERQPMIFLTEEDSRKLFGNKDVEDK